MADASLFRVHFEDGEKFDVSAPDADAARKLVLSERKGIVTKVKRAREDAA